MPRCKQWRRHGSFWGKLLPHFCQDGAQDLLKIDEKINQYAFNAYFVNLKAQALLCLFIHVFPPTCTDLTPLSSCKELGAFTWKEMLMENSI